MNPRPIPAAYPAGTELNVSIAGSSHETIAAAMDEAVARLNVVTSTIPRSEQERDTKSIDPTIALNLIHSICRAPHRRDAVAELVGFLDARSFSCNVRGGIGQVRIHRIYDPRLGWLGPESSLFDSFRDRWDSSQSNGDRSDHSQFLVTDDSSVLEMKSDDPPGRCILWIDGPPEHRESLLWLADAAQAIGSAFWSRPRHAWPALGLRLFERRKMWIAVGGGLLVLASMWPVSYRVACNARVETTGQRLIATPFEATLERACFKPGDIVKSGDVLLQLDGRPLRLEREAIEAEQQQIAKERDAARANGRIAESQQAALKILTLARKFELLNDRLQNLEVLSPIDGVVVSGDLDRFIGSPLEQGQTLMEIAGMNQMVIEIEIPEHEIGYVEQGAESRIKVDAIGGKSIRATVQEIYPRAELRDDRNVFIAKIQIDNADHSLKPGMTGNATLYGPVRPWLWSWIRGGYEKLLWWIGY